MLFCNAAVSIVLALASSIVVAFPANGGCGNTGDLHCCNSVQSSKNEAVISLFDLLGQGPQLAGDTAQVGMACSPMIGGTGGAVSCGQQAACCSGGTQFNGFLAMGCTAMNLPPA